MTLVSRAQTPLPLSVVIVARNEERNLPRCLASVRGWVEEIVLVLNHTTDRSGAIGKEYGATVHETAWLGFRDTKNVALDKAKCTWVLALDADEEVSPALRDAIHAFFGRGDNERFGGADFPRKVWFLNRWITHGDWYPDFSLRLFSRDKARWDGDAHVHEKVKAEGPVAHLRGDLHHYSFASVSDHVSKINPFADLFLQAQLERDRRFQLWAAISRPCWRFFRGYILRRGFLDGFPGLYIAVAVAFGTFIRYTRLYEHEQQPSTPPQDA